MSSIGVSDVLLILSHVHSICHSVGWSFYWSIHWLVGRSVTFFTPSNAHDISATKRATGDPLECQNDRIFEGFLDFPKNDVLDFWIS